ncbi:integrase core domain-containing protein [Paracoccus nototheniae]|uniref:integrase core domain-containing protein n=1 Tax=Paracoccus nototheniae TaxID=2489002 RepID=UPI003BF9F4DB
MTSTQPQLFASYAQEKLETWRRHYNEDRPHRAIGYNVPIALHYPGGAASPSP